MTAAVPRQAPPPLASWLPRERRLIRRLSTPARMQAWLNALPYNRETPPQGETLRSLRGVLAHQTAHCLEAALASAAVLGYHGYPPLVLSFESIDKLDHVLFVYREAGRWGAVARSRDPGLHGRKPVFRTARDLARSYFDPYIDRTGCITAFAVVDLDRELPRYDWRQSTRNVWKVEQMLIDYRHTPLPVNWARERRLRARYVRFVTAYPDRKPVQYEGRQTWSPLPRAYTRRGYEVDWV